MASANEILAAAYAPDAYSTRIPPYACTGSALRTLHQLHVSSDGLVTLVGLGLSLERASGSGRVVVTAQPSGFVLLDTAISGEDSGHHLGWTGSPGGVDVVELVGLDIDACAIGTDTFHFMGAISAFVMRGLPSAVDLLGKLAD